MHSTLKKIKQQFKSEPSIILKKPWLLPQISIIILQSVLIRFKKSKTVVYLTETKLSEIQSDEQLVDIMTRFQTILHYKQFEPYAVKRIQEDSEVDDYYHETVRQRFVQGDFVIVFQDGENNPVSFVFLSTKTAVFTPVGMTLLLPERTFGLFDVYTFKDARGKGYYSQLFLYSVNYMQSQGYEKIWLWLMAHNTISVHVHNKLGLHKVIKILSEKVSFGMIRKKINDVQMNTAELEK